MTVAQRRVYEEIVNGRRGRMVGPLRAVIHNPDLAQDWSRLGARLRYETSLDRRHSELAIIATARHWTSEVEWSIHATEALGAGVPLEVVQAIGAGLPPSFDDAGDSLVYEYARQLLNHSRVDPGCYASVRERWGDVGLVELTALIGYYSMVAMMLNANDIPLPPDGAQVPTMNGTGRCDLPGAVGVEDGR